MSLGKNIYRLRTARELSQGDLADALEVSRQSVSKWETDGAVPELDKLVKLCDLFGVTLDELVRGAPEAGPVPAAERSGEVLPGAAPDGAENIREGTAPSSASAPTAAPAAEQAAPLTAQKLVGILLIFAGGLVELSLFVLCLNGNEVWMFLIMAMYLAPPLVCGVLCLTTRRHTGLWCLWAVFAGVFAYLEFGTGLADRSLYALVMWSLHFEPASNITRLVIAWVCFGAKYAMLLLTAFRFRRRPFPRTPQHVTLLCVSWLASLVVFPLIKAIISGLYLQMGLNSGYVLRMMTSPLYALWLGALAVAVSFTVQAVCTWRRNRKDGEKAG